MLDAEHPGQLRNHVASSEVSRSCALVLEVLTDEVPNLHERRSSAHAADFAVDLVQLRVLGRTDEQPGGLRMSFHEDSVQAPGDEEQTFEQCSVCWKNMSADDERFGTGRCLECEIDVERCAYCDRELNPPAHLRNPREDRFCFRCMKLCACVLCGRSLHRETLRAHQAEWRCREEALPHTLRRNGWHALPEDSEGEKLGQALKRRGFSVRTAPSGFVYGAPAFPKRWSHHVELWQREVWAPEAPEWPRKELKAVTERVTAICAMEALAG